jgi:hypothetical protein
MQGLALVSVVLWGYHLDVVSCFASLTIATVLLN